MRKSGIFIFGLLFLLAAASGTVKQRTASASYTGASVYIGGMSAGFSLSTGGAQVIGISDVASERGNFSPAKEAGLKTGDVITKAAGIRVKKIGDLNEILAKNKLSPIELTVKRGETELKIDVQPVQDKVSGRYKIGVLIRDSVSGIGTVTYIDKVSHTFGALGHAVVGEDRQAFGICGGAVYTCSIVGVTKGIRGRAGELRGMFLSDKPFGEAQKICASGIYGKISDDFDYNALQSAETAELKEVKIGKAYVYSTVCGVYPKKYSVEIVKVDKTPKNNKNFVVKITDKDLIEETGGIVQGMSGSPILQDDKLVGAITHVFLNDPTRGYGIDINTMLKE